ncbi:MAG: LytTR family DNA-binding domain-containing protein [Bacteroidota bacterium]
MLKCIIIDDEPLAVKLLLDHATQTTDIEVVAHFHNPIEGIQALEDYRPDLILLDVQMPELSGIQFAKIVQGRYPVILTTAYEQYALEGYQLDIVDYLLKPISLERFQQAITKMQQRLSGQTKTKIAAETGITQDYIFVKSGYKTVRIDFDDILYLEGLSDYVRIQTKREAILTLDTMKHLLEALPNERFMRVHKSYIIALDKIDFIERNRITVDEKIIPISATYQEVFWERIKTGS